ncbi:unnamed protein product [Dibothriocephalus latus]|uniref:Uncharacterized protein n=1 Tax=Dibothriocephalus latus TaxID=60516 RepID=A0A3P7NYF3_DIBLA|nr:unnamed protein product [Dibothriocephalus latus]
MQEYLERKKIQRQEEERVRQIEDEKRRREQGKTLVSAKIKFQEDEMRRAAEQTKREKAEDKAYRYFYPIFFNSTRSRGFFF